MSSTKAAAILAVTAIPLSLVASWLMAKAGAPQEFWLWCQILRAC